MIAISQNDDCCHQKECVLLQFWLKINPERSMVLIIEVVELSKYH
jgi:hypothetical protein